MGPRKIAKGETFIHKGDHRMYLYVLLQGKVQASYISDVWELEPGSIIGMLESCSEVYLCDYRAMTDGMLYAYDYTKPEDFLNIFMTDKKYVSVFVMAAMRQTAFFFKRHLEYQERAQSHYAFLIEMHQKYEKFCKEYKISMHTFQKMELVQSCMGEEKINPCMFRFYEKLAAMSLEDVERFLERDEKLGIGEILNGTDWMLRALNLIEELREYLIQQREILLDAKEDNLYQRYFDLAVKAAAQGQDITALQEMIGRIMEYAYKSRLYGKQMLDGIFAKYQNHNFTAVEVKEETGNAQEAVEEEFQPDNFLEQILEFAEYDGEKAEQFRACVTAYKNLTDIYSTTDEVRVLRKKLTAGYYEIYTKAFKKSLDGGMTNGIRMFLNFGFMDMDLTGEDAAKGLYSMAQKLFLCKASNVYTIYEWLLSIYKGENEPSRNEFDLDYPAYIQEQRKSGDISEDKAKEMLQDNWEKVQFEIENMFKSNSRMTYGRISTFCPLLCEYDIINPIENMLVTAEKINTALDYIREIDFSIFYRKIVFSDPEKDINMEMIQKEVLPSVILMPNAGSRAMMWQEISGVRKDTPARIMFPILTVSNIQELMIDVAGRYRWEICRRIQGVRWNDVTDPSLTSEYNDYVQYYRKNPELSADAKEKVKNALQKSKNNFREVFVKDYQSWLNYEAKGSFRLNKVSRALLFKYCPFAKHIRERLKINPMYQEMFQKYDILNERVIRRLDMVYDRYRKKGGVITKELQDNRDFCEL